MDFYFYFLSAANRILHAGAALCAALALVPNAQAQGRTEQALKSAKFPQSLEFLQRLKLPPRLDEAIAKDIGALSPDDARARIIERLRLNLVATETFSPLLAAQPVPPSGSPPGLTPRVEADPAALLAWRRALAVTSRSADLAPNAMGLAAAIPDRIVVGHTRALYGKLAETLQIQPGIAIDDMPTASKAPPLVIGAAPQTTLPGPPANKLEDCTTPFEDLKKTCQAVGDGFRCEKFVRKEFSEVARIVTPTGLCSGTLIAPRWVVSAAHCFLGSTSVASYIKEHPAQRTAEGDAVLRQQDLDKIEIHFEHTPRGERSRRAASRVVVHRHWDPTKMVKSDTSVVLGQQTFTPDFKFPGDMALIHLAEDDALEAEVKPALIANKSHAGVVTTAGYGVTTVGDKAPGKLFVTWPEPRVANTKEDQLELSFEVAESSPGKPAKLVSTFCVGDSGGPAFAARHRGCQTTATFERPRVLVGITSYYWGYLPSAATTWTDTANFCQTSPVMRFVNVAAVDNRSWICKATKNESHGC